MDKVYENALHRARQRVWDDEKYASIIAFCKQKLADKWYARQQALWHQKNDFITI